MNKLLKFLKYTTVSILLLIVLVLAIVFIGHKFIFKVETSSIPTVADIKADGFCFGVGCHNQSKNEEEYVKVLAEQIKIYNSKAPDLWVSNSVLGFYALVESIENDKSWLISPDGAINSLSSQTVNELAPDRPRMYVGFSRFEKDGIKGIYLALSEKDINNVLSFQKYQHLGTYDLFITYCHELFHMEEQTKWALTTEKIANKGRNDRFEDTEARILRNHLYRQLLSAVAANDSIQKRRLTLDVIATFNDYKHKFKNDYTSALYFDRIEGTAFYYELISSLYSAYPEKVYSPETLNNALIALAGNSNGYAETGLLIESYWIGGWTCVLLDQLSEGNSELWKQQLMQNPKSTPMQLLADQFSVEQLPPPLPIEEKERNKVLSLVKMQSEQGPNYTGLFRMLYDMIF